MKKIMAVFLALALIFTPAGNFVFHQTDQQVSAKGYRSGVKSFQSNRGSGTNSFFGNRQNRTQNSRTATTSRNFTGGSFMRGMIFGGLSGLLFGSLLSHFGGFGMMAGFLINIIAILVVLALIRYLITSFTNRSRRNRSEDSNPWKR
ncbi:hypothetical protein [Sporolactobacillus laevolacticus]|uniref:hypothetical protein n=1 Tax=Sporolactobacillus laevolacticus TaxID=33018 RepID=UPI0025B2FA75|nr:hypothetical protein [Sporolactobacillus laevolacticus]MDN3956872.1 hypothetical protein [Sporolactobacillus laevolacticus]